MRSYAGAGCALGWQRSWRCRRFRLDGVEAPYL
jgi:hypothetical protein